MLAELKNESFAESLLKRTTPQEITKTRKSNGATRKGIGITKKIFELYHIPPKITFEAKFFGKKFKRLKTLNQLIEKDYYTTDCLNGV